MSLEASVRRGGVHMRLICNVYIFICKAINVTRTFRLHRACLEQ